MQCTHQPTPPSLSRAALWRIVGRVGGFRKAAVGRAPTRDASPCQRRRGRRGPEPRPRVRGRGGEGYRGAPSRGGQTRWLTGYSGAGVAPRLMRARRAASRRGLPYGGARCLVREAELTQAAGCSSRRRGDTVLSSPIMAATRACAGVTGEWGRDGGRGRSPEALATAWVWPPELAPSRRQARRRRAAAGKSGA